MNKKIYPTGVIKTKDGKIDICLTLQNEINWMKTMRSRLKKPVPIDKSTMCNHLILRNRLMDSELSSHIMALMKVLKQIKINKWKMYQVGKLEEAVLIIEEKRKRKVT